jgi:hypothetical protein
VRGAWRARERLPWENPGSPHWPGRIRAANKDVSLARSLVDVGYLMVDGSPRRIEAFRDSIASSSMDGARW